jgi:hypothetical protein
MDTFFPSRPCREAWRDLIGERSKEKSSVVRKLRRPKPAQEGGEQEETGQAEAPQTSGALMVVKSAGEAWEALQARLREAPIIQDILAGTKAIGKQTGATKVAKRAREAVGDKVRLPSYFSASCHYLIFLALLASPSPHRWRTPEKLGKLVSIQ